MNLAKRILNRSTSSVLSAKARLGPPSARLTFRLLTRMRPADHYQPVPWLGINGARGDASEARWAAIKAELETLGPPGSAMDLGAQLGYFSFRLAESGWLALAVEANRSSYELMRLIQSATAIPNVVPRRMHLTSETVGDLPAVDVVIFLSLWHHLCRGEGFDKARHVLREVLKRTNKVCFFETGQSDEQYMDWSSQLPSMQPDAKTWLTQLLLECGAREVRSLGTFDTYLGPVQRELLAAYTQPVIQPATVEPHKSSEDNGLGSVLSSPPTRVCLEP